MADVTHRFDRLFPLIYAAVYAGVALGVQLAWFPIGDIGTESDFYGDLVIAAQRMWAGDFSVTNYPFKGPLTSLCLVGLYAIVSPLGGDWYRCGVTLNVVCAALFLIVLYRILLRTFNRAVAVCTTVGVSLVFEFFLHAHKASSDLLFLLLCYLALERLTARGWTLRRLALAGALSGLAYLTRYNGLILPVVGVLILLLVDLDRRPWRRRLQGAVIYLAIFVVVVAPWYAVNFAETGRPLATRNLQNIFVEEIYGPPDAADADPDRPDSLIGLVRRAPLKVAARYVANVKDHLFRELHYSLEGNWTVLLILGLGRMLVFPPRRRHWAFFVLPLTYFLAMCSVYYQPRFGFSSWAGWIAVGFVALAGDGVDRRGRLGERLYRLVAGPVDRLRARLPRHTGYVVLAAVALLLFSYQISDLFLAERFYLERRPLFVLDLAPQLKRLAAGDDEARVLARKPHLAHYAELPYVQYPRELTGPTDFVAFAATREARFVVYSEIERNQYPESRFLGELSRYAGVTRAYEDGETVIYELAPGLSAAEAVVNAYAVDLERRLAEARENDDPRQVFGLSVMAAEARGMDGDLQAAARLLESGLAALPTDDAPEVRTAIANARLNLANTYLELDRPEDGIALLAPVLADLLRVLPSLRQAHVHLSLARLQERVGRTDIARLHYAHAHDLYLANGEGERVDEIRLLLEKLD